MAEQIDRMNKPGSRAWIKRVTAKERRQSVRQALHRCLDEIPVMWDRQLEWHLRYADLISPASKTPYYGWDD